MIAYFVPLERVGDFTFGSEISNYLEKYDFKFYPKDEITEWETYDFECPNISIWVEKGKIESIACYEECLYKGRNMIGMHIDEFMNFYELQHEGEVDKLHVDNDSPPQEVYEFDKIDVQVWCENDIIVTVITSNYNEE